MKIDKLITTPLLQPEEMPVVKIIPARALSRFRTLNLLLRMFGFGLRMFWLTQVRKLPPSVIAPQVRAFLEGLGGLWIKAGQLFSLRLDVLSTEMADELSQLQHRAFGFDPLVSKQVIEDALGQPVEAVFDDFEAHPFAAASISQVHRARVRKDGKWVVIKVQRPGIQDIFERDLKVITALLGINARLPAANYIDWDTFIRELQRIMREEIDYRYEAANLRRMRKSLRKHKVFVPKIYRKLSGERIIVMEEIRGPLMTDFLTVERKDPERLARWLAENNIKTKKVGGRLVRSFYRQLLEDNLFHGDLHPGNIVLLKNSRFALIDLGAIGSVDSRFLDIYKNLSIEIVEGNYDKAMDYLLMMADKLEVLDTQGFKTEMVELYRYWEMRSHLEGLTYRDKSVTGSDIAAETTALSAKYRVGTSWQFLRITRAFSTMDFNLSALMGDTSPLKVQKKYFKNAEKRAWKRFKKKGVTRIIGDVAVELNAATKFTTDSLRYGAIQFEGVQTKVDKFFQALFGGARWALILGLLVLAYDFVHLHLNDWVDTLHDRLGGWVAFAEQIPPYTVEFGIVLAFVVVYFIIQSGRISARFGKKTVRLPSGRLDS